VRLYFIKFFNFYPYNVKATFALTFGNIASNSVPNE
jgi:hypothetical protein